MFGLIHFAVCTLALLGGAAALLTNRFEKHPEFR